MKKTCPLKFTDRKPDVIKEYLNGFICGCIISEDKIPPSAAPADCLRLCDFTDHRGDPCKDDGSDIINADRRIMTPDEALDEAMIRLGLVIIFFERNGIDAIFKDPKIYKKLKGLLQHES